MKNCHYYPPLILQFHFPSTVTPQVRVLGTLPIIRSPPGGAAEMLANDVCSMLRDAISSRSGAAQSLFEDCLVGDHNRPRPLLLILDRTADLFPLLQHTSTYQALIHDMLDYHLNRVNIEVSDSSGNKKKKTYDLNTQTDPFLRSYAGVPFPEAIEGNEKVLVYELSLCRVVVFLFLKRPVFLKRELFS